MIYKIILRKLTIGQHKPHRQERLSSIIGPWEKECTGIPTHTTTRVEKLQMSIKLNILSFYWYSNKISALTKHAMHNIHKLALGPYVRGPNDNCPACPCVKTTLPIGKREGCCGRVSSYCSSSDLSCY